MLRFAGLVTIAVLTIALASNVSAGPIPPGAKPVAKVRAKPLGNGKFLFEITNFDCPAGIKTAKGRQRYLAQWKGTLGREACRNLSRNVTSELVRITYCRKSVVLEWTASKKTCGG